MTTRPEPEELTPGQIEELNKDLLALREELSSINEITKEDVKPVDLELPIGRVSRIDAIQQQSMAKAGRAANERRLALIAVALSAIEQGDYGYCRECDDPVGYHRLKARPETPFCVECQQAKEKRS